MPADYPHCQCQPASFPHDCQCLQITLSSHDAWLVATGEPLIKAGQSIPYDREATLAAWGARRETATESSHERDAELRLANRMRCDHRGVDSIREEPCACPTIGLLPIYRCGLLAADCADLRRPHPPAIYCLTCRSNTFLEDR